jgi:hypothetical protein
MTSAAAGAGALTLRFGSPAHGWLDVELRGAEGVSSLDASDVPGDSLAMLARAARDLIVGAAPGEVVWFLEPEEVTWRFRRAGDHVEVRAEDSSRRPALIGVVATTTFAALVLEALRTLATDPAWRDATAWSQPFPTADVDALARALHPG